MCISQDSRGRKIKKLYGLHPRSPNPRSAEQPGIWTTVLRSSRAMKLIKVRPWTIAAYCCHLHEHRNLNQSQPDPRFATNFSWSCWIHAAGLEDLLFLQLHRLQSWPHVVHSFAARCQALDSFDSPDCNEKLQVLRTVTDRSKLCTDVFSPRCGKLSTSLWKWHCSRCTTQPRSATSEEKMNGFYWDDTT